jgi:hypothetical protein
MKSYARTVPTFLLLGFWSRAGGVVQGRSRSEKSPAAALEYLKRISDTSERSETGLTIAASVVVELVE